VGYTIKIHEERCYMSNFSLNDDVPVGIEQEVVGNAEVTQAHVPQVHFENLETYKIAVTSMRMQLISLVSEGFVTESVAERLLSEFQYNNFGQIIKLRFE
jgi:hypothetical protein